VRDSQGSVRDEPCIFERGQREGLHWAGWRNRARIASRRGEPILVLNVVVGIERAHRQSAGGIVLQFQMEMKERTRVPLRGLMPVRVEERGLDVRDQDRQTDEDRDRRTHRTCTYTTDGRPDLEKSG
jgi:hypothetical protein